jgi:hypothetical protein
MDLDTRVVVVFLASMYILMLIICTYVCLYMTGRSEDGQRITSVRS